MTVTATYQFDAETINNLEATIKITMTVREWRKLAEHLTGLQDQRALMEPAKPLLHCVENVVKAIDKATGNAYGTRGFSYEAAKQEQEGSGT